MAKNQVTLTFAGDSTSLERSFDRVGNSARDMDDKVRASGAGFDRVGESADNLDTRAMGFRDTITGVQDTMRGLTDESLTLDQRLLMLGMGFGDLASGVANFGVQFAQQIASFVANTARMVATHATAVASTVAGWVVMGAQSLLAGAKMALAWLIGLGPVGLVIAAIAGIIAILVALGVDFDDVKNAIGAGWEFIKRAATSAASWIGDRVSDIVGFVTGIPDRIASAAKSIGSTIINGIKSGITGALGFASDIAGAIKGAINSALHLPFTINGPGPLPDFTIPAFHQGGTFRAPAGQREGLALLLDGERVSRPGQGGPNVTIVVQGSLLTEGQLISRVRDELMLGGFGGVR